MATKIPILRQLDSGENVKEHLSGGVVTNSIVKKHLSDVLLPHT